MGRHSNSTNACGLAVAGVPLSHTEWRQHFNADCIIDLVGYRRFGHNEGDQPMFTQPAMYSRIKQQPSTLTLYRRFLLENGHVRAAPRVVAHLLGGCGGG